jgi:hypothetical protein
MAVGHASEAGAAARETREIEGMLELSRRLVDAAQKACARTSEMKHRLLGLVEPTQIAKDGPKPVPCELTELRQNLHQLDSLFGRLHDDITALERI